jgi:NADPH-dependent curcumin reductase CurA
MTQTHNRRVLLTSRPKGSPTPDNFRLDEADVPVPGDGQVLLRNLYLSLDPYMRGRMSDAPSYVPPFPIGAPLGGATVSQVAASRHDGFAEGDLVLGFGGWQEFALSDGSELSKLAGLDHPSLALGVLGMPGFTAWHGLLAIGEPKEGETLVVAAASGAVGSAVGQIAKIRGCRVVGIAGGADKCRYVTDELGFDACLDHRDPGLAANLAAAAPDGVDIYFENVGGAVFDAVLPLLNVHARVPVCGMVSSYNDTQAPTGPDRLPLLMRRTLVRRIRMQGFIISDHYATEFQAFQDQMGAWVSGGRVKHREDVTEGLENAPEAFIGLLAGRNFGKAIVRIAEASVES